MHLHFFSVGQTSWFRKGIPQFNNPTTMKSSSYSPTCLPFGDTKGRNQAEIRAICWKQQWAKETNSSSNNISNKSVQREGILYLKCWPNEKQCWKMLHLSHLLPWPERVSWSERESLPPAPCLLQLSSSQAARADWTFQCSWKIQV